MLPMFWAIGLVTYAQNINLVPNGDFEDFTECPDGLAQIDRAIGWKSFRGSCDYFNACDATGDVGVPLNQTTGFQPALSGNGYGGLIALTYSPTIREILGATLLEPLQINQEYYMEFFWSRTFGGSAHSHCDCASSHLGALMTTQEYDAITNPIPFDDFAHVYDNNLLVDTVVWRKISGWFTADSAYTHIAIGNFFDLSLCDTAYFNGSPFPPDPIFLNTYYYIENVCVATDPEYCNSPIGISEERIKSRYVLYPNPASNILRIKGLENKSTYHVYDMHGREMKAGTVEFDEVISIDTLANGLYIFQLETSNGVWTERFMKIP